MTEEASSQDALAPHPWREETLRQLLTLAAVLGPIIAVVGTSFTRAPRPIPLLVAVWGCAGLVVLLAVQRRFPYRVAASLSIAALYLPAQVAAFYYGLNPGAGVVTTAAVVLAAIYFGRAAALALLAPALLELLVIGWLYTHGQLDVPRIREVNSPYFPYWTRIVATFGLITAFLAAAIHYLMGRLEQHYQAAMMAGRQLRGAEARWQKCAEELIILARSETIESGRLRAAFRQICEAGARGLTVERCSVWLLDEPGTNLRCLNLFELTAGRHTAGTQFPAELCPAYFKALDEERTLAVRDARNDPRTAELSASYLAPLGITSMLDAPIRHRDRLVGVVCHEHLGEPLSWPPEALSFAGSMADFAARALAAVDRAGKDRGLRTAYQQLGQLNRRLESAKEEERRHIAHELHDELGQELTALKFQLLARAGAPNDAVALLNGVLDRVRRLSLDLRPPLLDEVGLAPALRAHLETRAAQSGVAMTLETHELDRVAPETEMAAYRLVQEAVTNVLRHAGAKSVAVSVNRGPGAVEIGIRDDGRGFVPEETLDRAAAEGHIGLVGMRERARALGGEFALVSQPGAGTTITVRLPVAE